MINGLYPLFVLHTFMAYESKIFQGVSKSLGGAGGKYFLKVNNFFTLIFIGFLILYLNSLLFSLPIILLHVIF